MAAYLVHHLFHLREHLLRIIAPLTLTAWWRSVVVTTTFWVVPIATFFWSCWTIEMDDETQFGDILQCPGGIFVKAKMAQHSLTIVSKLFCISILLLFDPTTLSCVKLDYYQISQIGLITCPSTIAICPLFISSGGATTIWGATAGRTWNRS